MAHLFEIIWSFGMSCLSCLRLCYSDAITLLLLASLGDEVLIIFWVSRRRRKMYCGHARLCVCVSVWLSAAVRPHYCMDPDVTWGHGRGCPLVVHYWADLQLGHGLRCYGNITRTLVTSLRPSHDMTTVWTAGWAGSARAAGRWLAGDGGRSQNCAPYMGSGRGWLAGDWPSTGGVLNITAAAWTACFLWWHSGNKKRTQNVSKYMIVLAVCLVVCVLHCGTC